MGKFYITIILFFISTWLYSQTSKFPYPIIFVHGLNSNADTWNETINILGGQQKIFDVCLNHDNNNSTANIDNDVVAVGWRDNDFTTPSPTRLYAINFDNNEMTGHVSHNQSNQAAIYKQGKALKLMINLVLELENSEKVILVGHSMGGLAIREYLQRIENGSRKWWVDTTDNLSGHKVAKVVTIGTPHLGSNAFDPLGHSEAVRDLRYSFITGTAPYLFGGNESIIPTFGIEYFNNKDVNCNGIDNDEIFGISQNTSYNHSMSLPSNIEYELYPQN